MQKGNNETQRETPCLALEICEFHQSYFETEKRLSESEDGLQRGTEVAIILS